MKNLFDYARKELSQDAFLRWLFENYDDPIVGTASKELISKFAQEFGDSIVPNTITSLKTYAQMNHIDIQVEFCINNIKCLLAIEDKVHSSNHSNQLKRYNQKILTLNYERTYRIYYKTDFIGDSERKEVNASEWKIFGSEEIAHFFLKFTSCENEILRDYSNYVLAIRNSQENVADKKPIKDWNFTESRTFIKKIIEQKCEEKYGNKIKFWHSNYRGKLYATHIYYFGINGGSYLRPCLELVFRSGDSIQGYIHISTVNAIKEETWKCAGESCFFWTQVLKKYQECTECLFKAKKSKEDNDYGKRMQTLASLKSNITKTTIEATTNEIMKVIDDFCKFYSSFDC